MNPDGEVAARDRPAGRICRVASNCDHQSDIARERGGGGHIGVYSAPGEVAKGPRAQVAVELHPVPRHVRRADEVEIGRIADVAVAGGEDDRAHRA